MWPLWPLKLLKFLRETFGFAAIGEESGFREGKCFPPTSRYLPRHKTGEVPY
jgi:hypothetical protein